MTNEWYYAKAGKKEGPVSIDDLKRLVQQGQLQPTDHVWKQGMATWVPASSVEGLFGAEPPPLPPIPVSSQPGHHLSTPTATPTLFSQEGFAAWMKWLDDRKIKVSLLWFLAWLLPGLLMSIISRGHPEWLLLFGGIGTIPTWVFGARYIEKQKRKKNLHGLWEPISGQGVYFQFTEDGALVRGDGIATRYRWLSDDMIELYTDDASPKVQIEVLSLSKMEMIVRADGQGGHFKKGVTVTEAEAERARQAAWSTAGAIAGGGAMLALGGLAVLGGMAAGTAAGGGGGSSDARWCPKCGKTYGLMDRLRSPACVNCGAKLP